MKKLLLFIAFIGLFGFQRVNAQCTPVPFPPPALTNPDTTMGIPPAVATQPYSEIVNVRVPADTIVMGTNLPIDSIGVDSITGIPPTFSYATNSPNDYWKGGTFGCFIVQGTPAESDTGVYTMILHTKIFVGHNPNNTILYSAEFEFIILDSSKVGFRDITGDQFAVRQNAPNPFDDKTTIRFNSPQMDVFSFEVYNVAGQLVRKELIQANMGINQIEFAKGDLPSGMYIYQLSNEKYNVRKRMIIR